MARLRQIAGTLEDSAREYGADIPSAALLRSDCRADHLCRCARCKRSLIEIENEANARDVARLKVFLIVAAVVVAAFIAWSAAA